MSKVISAYRCESSCPHAVGYPQFIKDEIYIGWVEDSRFHTYSDASGKYNSWSEGNFLQLRDDCLPSIIAFIKHEIYITKKESMF